MHSDECTKTNYCWSIGEDVYGLWSGGC